MPLCLPMRFDRRDESTRPHSVIQYCSLRDGSMVVEAAYVCMFNPHIQENGARGAEQYYLDNINEVNNTVFAMESDSGTFLPTVRC